MSLALEQLPDWPAAMDRDTALAYTSFAPKIFNALERNGSLVGKPYGRNGTKIYDREALDAARRRLFGRAETTSIDDEFDGIG